MALKLRRGTDSGRTAITPAEGEPIYTTDTKKLYIGDGTTAGGVAVDTAVTDGDKGDITVSGGGTVWTIDAGAVIEADIATNAVTTNKIANDAVTYAKIQNVSTTSRLLGRASAGAGDIEEITIGSGLTLTGTTISASGGGGGLGAPSIVKTSTNFQSVTNSTTPVIHNELRTTSTDTGGVLGTYIWELYLIANTLQGSQQVRVEISSGGQGQWFASWNQQADALLDQVGDRQNFPLNQTNFSGRNLLVFRGVARFGQFWDFQFRFAQSVSNANSVEIQAGSQLKMWKVV